MPDTTAVPPHWTPTHGEPYRPVPYRPERTPADESLARAAQLRRRMDERRTVRRFSADPVPEQVVKDAIACAATAPSGAHQQPWTFVLVKDPEVRRRIREAAEHEERISYDGRLGEEWLAALRPLGKDAVKAPMTDAPALVVVFQQRYWVGEDGARHKHYYVDESVGIAVGMLLSALHLSGLAALIHTPSPMRFLREVLDRPENEKAFAVIPVGYPADDCQVPDLVRKSLDQVLVEI
ncbi:MULTISPECIES: nitroreductase family protein [unclassified Streptomyces]|uniref:nitroreductase family protein n=1 Tax=unclassified Streptomyces TaxID=2593676 RepID=UPI00224EC5F8|nr:MULTISPECIES: nitroreductase family protein [unclassified Streptomyces]MCX4789572.1 nitroreductase family protein [Streptomyces sp. NBC_01221]MCX4794702.1 nitroreductase family protein [Streptomyces sp. NBC_01242]WSJ36029.1 nitroreductase family protein [Streptomyces sp. NBC_01321]WSP62483.1 nitroreductase family protein [Streptomyces sp. NBC_01240]